MASPLAPVLANTFMGFHESKWLNEYNLSKPKFYLRYVDDIVAAFDNEQDSINFLNNRHPNLTYFSDHYQYLPEHQFLYIEMLLKLQKEAMLKIYLYYLHYIKTWRLTRIWLCQI